jgi:hypothetical protein
MTRVGDMSSEDLRRLLRDAIYEVVKETAREATRAQEATVRDTSELLRVVTEKRTPRWEYLFVRTAGRFIDSINWVRLEAKFDVYEHFKVLGEEGWELVCFADEYDHYIFKRPVSE